MLCHRNELKLPTHNEVPPLVFAKVDETSKLLPFSYEMWCSPCYNFINVIKCLKLKIKGRKMASEDKMLEKGDGSERESSCPPFYIELYTFIINEHYVLTKIWKKKLSLFFMECLTDADILIKGHTQKNSCSSDFPDKNSEAASKFFFFFFFFENDEAKFFFSQKELVLIGCVQYMIS